MAYKVEWDDHEGNRHKRTIETEEDARLEYDALLRKYDYAAMHETQDENAE